MNADLQIKQLSEALHLNDARQDWGIANSDASRVREFLTFCASRPLTHPQQYAMVELVLASMNDALAAAPVDEALLDDFGRFMASDLHGLPAQLKYWSSLTDPEEFPLAELLHHLAGAA